jgi:O-antigen/teichoic acid export membrane protein
MVLFSEQVIKILFGGQYRVAATALSILAFSNLVSATVGNIGSYLQSKEHNKIIFHNTAVTVVFNIGLNIYLIPKYGITGAAIATAISSILAEFFLFIETYRHEKVISLHPKMVKTVISGLTSITVIYITVDKLFVATPYWVLPPAAALFFALHFLIFLKIGGLTEYDKDIVLTLGRKFGVEKEVKKTLNTLT